MKSLQKNEKYTVEIDGYTSEGLGVCHIDGRAVFVPQAIPGEQWEIKILKVSTNAVYAKGEMLLRRSPARIAPDCPYYGKCGGCDTRHLSYEEELRFKLDRVNAALQHIGKQTLFAGEILGSEEQDRYRNKGIFAVATVNRKPSFGFYRERSHDLIPVDDCLLQKELCCRTARAVTDFMEEHQIPAYDEVTGKGAVRHVFCREARETGDAVLCVSSAKGFGALTQGFVSFLRQRCPEITGIVLNVNKSKGNTILSGDFYTLWGDESLHDKLCGLTFELAPQAFFQINPPQAEKLYERAAAYAIQGDTPLVFDLYCGAGTISLRMAQQADKVIGAEIVPEAVENATQNANRNGIENAEFLCADAGDAAKLLSSRGHCPNAVVVDPPRKGMSGEAIRAVASMKPERLVYVSCNPATLARDILRFNTFGYTLREVTAVDMFPRTCHVETVVFMTRSGTGVQK